MSFTRFMPALAALALLATAASASACENYGAVELSDGTVVPQTVALPTRDLTYEQREEIRQALLTEHADAEIQLASDTSGFVPEVGARLPEGVTAYSLPRPMLTGLPRLREFTYVLMNHDALIVQASTGAIVDTFASEPLPLF